MTKYKEHFGIDQMCYGHFGQDQMVLQISKKDILGWTKYTMDILDRIKCLLTEISVLQDEKSYGDRWS